MIRVNRASVMLLAALLLGWCWDQFFYDKALGIMAIISGSLEVESAPEKSTSEFQI
jgi:hypothetical protein